MDALGGVRVLDVSDNLSGAYCTKLLADVGADVVVLDASGRPPAIAPGHDTFALDPASALAAYLRSRQTRVRATGARSVALASLARGADIVVESGALDAAVIEQLRADSPGLVVVSIRPFGFDGPWADRPATEFTIQALSGGTIYRGYADREPLHAAGRIAEWLTGAYAAVATLGAHRAVTNGGVGEHVDVSFADVAFICFTLFQSVQQAMGGPATQRGVPIPSIEPAADGWVGFSVNTPDQFRAYTALLGRPELAELPGVMVPQRRPQYRAQLTEAAHSWLATRTVAEAVRLCSAERIPVAPVNTVADLLEAPHFRERGLFVADAKGRLAPRRPFLVDGHAATPKAPVVTDVVPEWPPRPLPDAVQPSGAPLAGVRVVDLTSWWAGPCATQLLAAFGAEVIKVESHTRYDGMRDVSARTRSEPDWWEWSWQYQAINTDKSGVALDLTRAEGRDALHRILAGADVLIENGSPGVLRKLGLEWDDLHERYPRLTLVRMPAFGLSGQWSEMRGFDPTAAQASGLASLTGYVDTPPIGPRGFCDDTAGVHAAFATLAALEETQRSGVGHHVESAMGDVVSSLLAEHLIEFQRTGEVPRRQGNRGRFAAPQGIYRCDGDEEWIAIAITTDEQWGSLREVIGDPAWARDASLATDAGRRDHHDALDHELSAFCATKDAADLAERLRAGGVPAERLLTPTEAFDSPNFRARAFAEKVEHAVVGAQEYPSLPFRFRSRLHEPWFRSPSPRVGEHNERVLTQIAGLTIDELRAMEAQGVIGTRPG
ncbi:MAG: CoA transferase [Microbacteriaceae bacterium]